LRIKFILVLLVILFILFRSNGRLHESTVNGASDTQIIPYVDEDQDISIKYQTVDVGSLINVLNTYYEGKLIKPFGVHMITDYPFEEIDSKYEYNSIDKIGNVLSTTKFIQARIEEEDMTVNISIIEDQTFDNGGYIFSNTYNFYDDYFNNENYTVSVYKYNKSYIVFEFFNMNAESNDKKDFITEFAKLLEENYVEREKLIYNADDENYTVETFPISSLTDGLNTYYQDRITNYFERYTKSEIPLYAIDEEDNNILAVTKYLQGAINDENVKISIVEDKTFDNNGFIFTTDEVNNNPMISIYRYNNIYIIFEFYNASISEDFMIDSADTVSDFSSIMVDILR